MPKPPRITFLSAVTARYLKLKKLLVLSGPTEEGNETEVRVPLEAMRTVMDAIEAAQGRGDIRDTDLPEASGFILVRQVQIGVVPNGGLTMQVTLRDGQEVTLMFESQESELALQQAAGQIANGLTLAIRGSSN